MNTDQIAISVAEILKSVVDERTHDLSRPVRSVNKGDGSVVTDIDLQIQEELIDRLSSVVKCPALAEEADAADLADGMTWVIDPIDGTANFIANLEFSSSVALCQVEAGRLTRTLAAVIYSPGSGAVYLASDSSRVARRITDFEERIHVSDNARLSDAIAIFGFPYNRAAVREVLAMVRGVAETARDVKRIGPASLDICKVAEGICDAYFERDLKPWDYAAAGLILEKAGGRFGRMGDFTVATNGLIHEQFLQALQKYPSAPPVALSN